MQKQISRLGDVELLAHSLELEELELYRDALSKGFIGYQKASLVLQTNPQGIKPLTIESAVANVEFFTEFYSLYSRAYLFKMRQRIGG